MKRTAIAFAASVVLVGSTVAEEPAPTESKVLVVERVIDAPAEDVWAAFVEAGEITAWMVPHAEVDLRIGGQIKTNYDPQGKIGDSNTIVNAILSFEPQRMLSLQNVKAPSDFPFAEGTVGTWSISYFTPLEGDRTAVRLVGLGWPDNEHGEKAYEFFERGNAYSLELLAQHLAGNSIAMPKSDGSDVPKEH